MRAGRALLLGFTLAAEGRRCELGQAFAVAVALPALALLRDTRWEPRVIWSTSLAILLVGVVLFVERALL